VLLGRAANGRTEWKDADGKTLKELQTEALGQPAMPSESPQGRVIGRGLPSGRGRLAQERSYLLYHAEASQLVEVVEAAQRAREPRKVVP
jgi:hypothetical protein